MNPEDQLEPLPIQPALSRSPISVMDNFDTLTLAQRYYVENRHRIEQFHQRFPWLANADHQWSPASEDIHYPVHRPNVYHLRRRPQIQCPACLNGELGQLGHMEGPHGCLFSEEVKENE